MYTYTDKSYLKKAFNNKHEIQSNINSRMLKQRYRSVMMMMLIISLVTDQVLMVTAQM